MIERRGFLNACAALIVAAGLGPTSSFAARTARTIRRKFERSTWRKDRFKALLNTWFHIYDETWNVVDVELVEVNDGPNVPQVEQFFVVFRGPHAPSLSAGSYDVQHYKAGSFRLFIQPARNDDFGQYYQAAFSLLR